MTSLFELLHSDTMQDTRKKLTSIMKYHIAYDLAKILYSLSTASPSMHHGHLTSHNVFVKV